jgi:hypothetical protein
MHSVNSHPFVFNEVYQKEEDRLTILSNVFSYLTSEEQEVISNVSREWKKFVNLVKCEEQIINCILSNSNQYVYFDKRYETKEEKTIKYGVIFRRSYSWQNILEKFKQLVDVETNTEWANDWINTLKAIYKQEAYSEDSDSSEDLTLSTEQISKLGDSDLDLNEETAQFSHLEEERLKIVQACKEKAEKQIREKEYPSKSCQEVLNHMIKHWDELTVFTEWSEVSLDSQNLAVRVTTQPDEVTRYLKCINHSLKAIFIISPVKWTAKDIKIEKEHTIQVIAPVKVDCKGKFGTSSPSPSPMFDRKDIIHLINSNKGIHSEPEFKRVTAEAQTITSFMIGVIHHINRQLQVENKEVQCEGNYSLPIHKKIFKTFLSIFKKDK